VDVSDGTFEDVFNEASQGQDETSLDAMNKALSKLGL
jgi:hypothetical protein